MIDETPEETPRDRLRETPAPDLPPGPREPRRHETTVPRPEPDAAPDSGPMRKGILAALGVFAAFVLAEAAAIGLVLAAADSPEGARATVDVGLIVSVLVFGAAVFVSQRLPLASRTAFWATGITCMGFVMTVLIGICGMQLARTAG